MFKVNIEEGLNQHPLKTTVSKSIRSKLIELYPTIEDHLDEIWPKKAKVFQSKIKGESHCTLYSIEEQIMFLEIRDVPLIPTLRLLHKYPTMMPHMQCDKGAIRHIMSGSHIMCPGLTSPGGKMDDVESGQIVAIMAEGKEHAMGIGITVMSTDEIKTENKGVAIELLEYLNDGMWKLAQPKP